MSKALLIPKVNFLPPLFPKSCRRYPIKSYFTPFQGVAYLFA